MRRARYRYSGVLLGRTPLKSEVLPDDVLNFFDTLGSLLKRENLDVELVWDVFSDQIICWWYAAQNYVSKAQIEDPMYFKDFRYLVGICQGRKENLPSDEDIRDFLNEEFRTYENAGPEDWLG